MPRPSIEIVHDYIFKVWNQGRVDLVPELCANPIIRYEPNAIVRLSHQEQVARIRHSYAELKTVFEDVVLSGDAEHITLVWNVTGKNPDWRLCGIEIFRVREGRITEVWNLPYAEGSWGMTRRLSERLVSGTEAAFPILSATLDGTMLDVEVPVDTRHIGRWIELVLGRAETEPAGPDRWLHRYGGAAERGRPLSLVVRDRDFAPRMLEDVTIESLSLRLVPSAVVNAKARLRGVPGAVPEPVSPTTDDTMDVVRLAETVGTISHHGREAVQVRDADIIFLEGGSASGHATLDIDTVDAARSAGLADLRFGWQQGDFSLMFDATVVLSDPEPLGPTEAKAGTRFVWTAERVGATLINDEPPRDDHAGFAISIETAD